MAPDPYGSRMESHRERGVTDHDAAPGTDPLTGQGAHARPDQRRRPAAPAQRGPSPPAAHAVPAAPLTLAQTESPDPVAVTIPVPAPVLSVGTGNLTPLHGTARGARPSMDGREADLLPRTGVLTATRTQP